MNTSALPDSASGSMISFLCGEAAFLCLFAFTILGTAARSAINRAVGLAGLCAATVLMEKSIVPLCLRMDRPHWAATVASLLWVQFLSASELVLVSRIHAAQLQRPHQGTLSKATAAVGLLWNVRRIGTVWQVKNVPVAPKNQNRIAFILKRIVVTVIAYLFVDAVVSMPPPEDHMVRADKATLMSLQNLDIGDVIFRSSTVAGYWLITGVLNLFMTNVGAIAAVTLGLSSPDECPPIYGPFSEAYTVRRFWGISWHQMFRSFLTGHANLIVNHTLPFFEHKSAIARYIRLTIAFLISGLIHAHADQLMGVANAENGALVFFLLHAAVIMLEDLVGPLLGSVLPRRVRYFLGYVWVFAFFAWSSPIWIYSGMRLGLSSAALLPIRVVGPLAEQVSFKSQA